MVRVALSGPPPVSTYGLVEELEGADGGQDRGEQQGRAQSGEGDVPEGGERPAAVDGDRVVELARHRLQPGQQDDGVVAGV
ncbi:hypothetical protein GCM10019017_08120 [Streptomyces showdoensis]